MLAVLDNLPPGVEGVKAVGTVSKGDYETVMVPLIDAARRAGRRLRFLYEMGPEFQGFSTAAAWEDAKIGLRSLRLFDGVAVVTDVRWIRDATRLAGFMMPCPVKVFHAANRDAAAEWLGSLPEGPTVSPRLIPDKGVLVLEVNHPLRTQDFDSVAVVADTWIASHGHLDGLVVHARRFPGWENLNAMLDHVRFVRGHHDKVERVAFAGDGAMVDAATRVAERLVHGEVKVFPYDDVEQAIAWASGGS